jgi:putative ABC transport system substrate-binding protein
VSWQSPAGEGQVEFLREGLTRLGYVEGRNIELETWFTDGNRERTQEVIRGLVQKPGDVLIVRVTPAAQLAKEATQTIPIVMIVADALATGLVPSLSRRGGNLTGLSLASPANVSNSSGRSSPIFEPLRFSVSPNSKPRHLSVRRRRRRR